MNTQSIVIHVTRKCNMYCNYCYEQDKDFIDVPQDILKKNVDLLLKTIDKTKPVELEFLGGEPLLNIKGINFIINYINTTYNLNIKYILTTNGSIFNDEIKEIILNNDFFISISLDGNSVMQNSCRHFKNSKNGTYDIVLKNSLLFKEVMDTKCCKKFIIHMTLHKYNVGFLYEGINELYRQGFNYISVGVAKNMINDDFYNNLKKNMIKVYENLKNTPGLKIVPFMEETIQIHKKVYLDNGNTHFMEIFKNIEIDEVIDDLHKQYFESYIEINNIYKNKYHTN